MTPKEIYVHHSLTKDGQTVSWGAIRKYHMTPASKGGPADGPWRDIGYHAGIELVDSGGILYFEILVGRFWNVPGAHAGAGHNSESLGFCFIGNYDVSDPPAEMLERGAKFIRSCWMDPYGIPIERVRRHSDVAAKTCPGKLFPWAKFIELLRR